MDPGYRTENESKHVAIDADVTEEDENIAQKEDIIEAEDSRVSVEANTDEKEKKGGKIFSRIRHFVLGLQSREIKHGKHLSDVPIKNISKVTTDVIWSYDSPEDALDFIHQRRLKRLNSEKTPVAGIVNWKRRSDECYGIVMSLYDEEKDGKRRVGDPVADCLGIVARPNNCILALADGVNWGERSMLASRSAIYGAISYLTKEYTLDSALTTKDVFRSILRAFESGQNVIMEEEGTLTTLCVGVVVELADRDKWGFCVVNVGDSLAFVYNEYGGVREVTVGSHSLDENRDMRYSGGALGPADGFNPDLGNLTCSYTVVETGDIVYLTSDGISDNFDPLVGKFQCKRRKVPDNAQSDQARAITMEDVIDLNTLTARERHQGMLNKMRDVIESDEGPEGSQKTARNLCGKFMNFAARNTNERRLFLEENSLTEDELLKLTSKERRERNLYIKNQLETKPGKLDHASIVAFKVGSLEPSPLKRVSSAISDGSYEIVQEDWMDGETPPEDFVHQEEDLSSTHEMVSAQIFGNLYYESSL